MSYALAGFRGMGTVVEVPCGKNAVRNPADQECYCNLGFEWADDKQKDCKPVNTLAPCSWTGEQRSTVDKKCACPPGTYIDPSPTGTACIPMSWFPSCVDANGNSVPNCLFGYPMSEIIPGVAVGAVIGAGIAFLFMRARS